MRITLAPRESTYGPDSILQDKLARFLENHDEPRAAATFSQEVHDAVAVITFLSPGLGFFHQRQFESCQKRISPHLVRAPAETTNTSLVRFYERLLSVVSHEAVRNVRFWRTSEIDRDGQPTWIGSASYDERVGLSHTTGQITHHIAPDVDSERDQLLTDLKQTQRVVVTWVVNYVDPFKPLTK